MSPVDLVLVPVPPCICGDDPCAENCPIQEDRRRNDNEEIS